MSKFILRFDDLNPCHDHNKWEQIESFLIENDIKPIVAVVPDNKDDTLSVDKFDVNFWNNIKRLQGLGWSIALHGFNHKLKDCNNSIVKTNDYGEICDLSYQEQFDLISKGVEIFEKNSIKPDLYCAPAHSFDNNTIKALKDNNIKDITDGYYLYNGYSEKYGINFIPQQLWRFRKLPIGIFTVCYHHNNMNTLDIEKFKKDVLKYKGSIIKVSDLKNRNLNVIDYVFEFSFKILMKLKKIKK